MSILHHPDAVQDPELQIWNNAAFDNCESEEKMGFKSSWCSESVESNSSKENLSPVFQKSPVSCRSSIFSASIKPLHSNTIVVNMQGEGNQLKRISKQGSVSKNVIREKEESKSDESKIDMEIEEVEKEISRLSSRLEALRLEKAERRLRSVEKRGKIVPAKFMEPKQRVENEEPLLSSSKTKISRRGVSLGPAEISSGSKSRFLSKQEITPFSKQCRRKSCFWELEEIDELKVIKERGKSLSVSPKSRKTLSKIQAQKQAATTVGCKRPTKKEDTVLALIRPKTLFNDGEKSAPSKKTVKRGRVVASRYSQIPTNQSNGKLTASENQKGSLPVSNQEEGNKRIASRGKGAIQKAENSCRYTRRWKIPGEVDVVNTDTVEDSHSSASVMAEVLPKINTNRQVNDTPRDSGAAKRMAELVRKKLYFCEEEEAAVPCVFQALSLTEEDAKEAYLA